MRNAFEAIGADVRFAIRSLARRRAFTVLVLATIGLGIGANTAIFTVVNAVLLQPLPFPEPDALVAVWEQDRVRGWDRVPASVEDFLAWRDETATMRALAGAAGGNVSLTGDGTPERLSGSRVTGDFFEVFGVAPLHGVPFDRSSNVEGEHHKVVLSHGLWQRRFGGDPGIVGRSIQLDGVPTEVVAVMPERFRFPSSAELWTPIVFTDAQREDRNWHFLLAVARLADGSTIDDARAEMTTIASRLSRDFPESNADWGVDVQPLHGEMTQGVSAMLWMLLGAVAFVLLIACANVANLLLVRASGRLRELSLRTALGAGRIALVRQLLLESLILAGAGGLIGLALAQLALDGLLSLSPVTVPGGGEIRMDGWVLGATAGGAALTGLLFGFVPAAAIWRTDLQTSLKEGRGQAAGSGHRVRSLLVVAEVALALVLVSGAGLMLQSVRRMLDVDVGLDTSDALVAQFSLPPAAYPTPERQVLFYEEVLARTEAIPGVRVAAMGSVLPPAGGGQYHVRVEGVHDAWTMDLPVARARAVSQNFIEAMGVPLVRGRGFLPTDGPDAPMVVVVDEALVAALFPGEDPIGQRIRTLTDEPREIVGVVGNVSNSGLTDPPGPTTYFPFAQHAFGSTQTLVLRTAGDPGSYVAAMQDAIWELDPSLPLVGVESLDDRLSGSVAQPRFQTILLSLFAALAVLLAAIGIYGVMAYSVSERTGELGLRKALGAPGSSLRALVLRKALGLTGAGVVLGVVASIGLSNVVERFLFGVEATDPMTLVAVAATLTAVATIASLVPAVRASRLDPLTALREE